VVGFYGDLMTDVERNAWRHLFFTMKATRGRSDVAAQREARTSQFSRARSRMPRQREEEARARDSSDRQFFRRTPRQSVNTMFRPIAGPCLHKSGFQSCDVRDREDSIGSLMLTGVTH
jgi:hypothetical protein